MQWLLIVIGLLLAGGTRIVARQHRGLGRSFFQICAYVLLGFTTSYAVLQVSLLIIQRLGDRL